MVELPQVFRFSGSPREAAGSCSVFALAVVTFVVLALVSHDSTLFLVAAVWFVGVVLWGCRWRRALVRSRADGLRRGTNQRFGGPSV